MKNIKTTEADVLFQKLGNTWYVFSEVNDDVVYSSLPSNIDPYSTKIELFTIVNEHIKKVDRIRNKRLNEKAA